MEYKVTWHNVRNKNKFLYIKKEYKSNTLTLKSGHSPRALSRVGVQSFAIHRAAATIPQCAYPKTKLLIPPSFKTEWWKGTTAPVAAVSVSFMLWVPRINKSKHFDCVSRIIVKAGFRSCRKMSYHRIKLQKNWWKHADKL
jgi:hypothetical protein